MKPYKNGWYRFGFPSGPKEIVWVFRLPGDGGIVFQRVGDPHNHRVEDTMDEMWGPVISYPSTCDYNSGIRAAIDACHKAIVAIGPRLSICDDVRAVAAAQEKADALRELEDELNALLKLEEDIDAGID